MQLKNLKKLTVYVSDSHYLDGKPLYRAILEKAYELELSGATVLKCVDGFGKNTRLKKKRILDLNSVSPVKLEFLDTKENLEKLNQFLSENLRNGLVTLEDVNVLKYDIEEKE